MPDGPMTDQEMELRTFGVNIWKYFTPSCYHGFGDDEKGFYAVYRNLFEIIKGQEERAKDDQSDSEDDEPLKNTYKSGKEAPGFGDSKTSYEKVEDFYKYWENFTTIKRFRWADQYNETQAPNRQVKRLMHKENVKERNKERKKFHDTMKSLVEFVKKRDPRYQELVKSKLIEKQKKIEEDRRREEEKKKEKAELRKKQREEEAARYEREAREAAERGEIEEQDDGGTGENIHYEDFYCDVCDKEFKTENQLNNHLNSKAHIKKYKQLMDEVMLEEEKLEMENKEKEPEEEEIDSASPQPKSKKKNKKKKKKNKNGEEDISSVPEKLTKKDAEDDKKAKQKEEEAPKAKASESEDDDDDDIDLTAYLKPKVAKKTETEQNETTQPGKNWNGSKFFQPHDHDEDEHAEDTATKESDKKPSEEKAARQGEGSEDEEDANLNDILPSKKAQKKKEKKKKKFQTAMGMEPEMESKEPVIKATTNTTASEAGTETKEVVDEQKKAPEEKKKAPEEKKKATEDTEKEQTKKLNAAKLKKMKKKEKEQEETFVCNVCKESFETRNKLFQHVKDKGHEFAGQVPQTKSKK